LSVRTDCLELRLSRKRARVDPQNFKVASRIKQMLLPEVGRVLSVYDQIRWELVKFTCNANFPVAAMDTSIIGFGQLLIEEYVQGV